MGMSSHVIGFIPPDDKWRSMKAVYNSCVAAGVDVPKDVDKFFGGEDPNDMVGREVSVKGAVRNYTSECCDGFEVQLDALPKEVKVLRFCNCY